MDIAVLGIDLGKTTCSVAGLDDDGTVVELCPKVGDGLIRRQVEVA